jgi:glycine/D-amino acid oxidase-like deaminating enzyme
MTRIEDCDTAVIGGGIIGCSIAYHLARLDVRSVLVLERLLAFYPALDEAQFVRFIAGLST